MRRRNGLQFPTSVAFSAFATATGLNEEYRSLGSTATRVLIYSAGIYSNALLCCEIHASSWTVGEPEFLQFCAVIP